MSPLFYYYKIIKSKNCSNYSCMLYLFDYNKKMIILTKIFLQKLLTVMYINMNKLTKLSALKSGSCEKKLLIFLTWYKHFASAIVGLT